MKKNCFMILIAATALLAASCAGNPAVQTVEKEQGQEVLDNIFARKSVRTFLDTPVEREKIDKMVRAGMAAPSGMDRRPWEIVVVDDRATLDSMAAGLPYAKMLSEAPLAMIVCGSSEVSEYWVVDCAAVTQNILLAAEALGLGAVWTGVYPGAERVDVVSRAVGLPAHIVPLNVIPMGYPRGEHAPKDKFDQGKVHYNRW